MAFSVIYKNSYSCDLPTTLIICEWEQWSTLQFANYWADNWFNTDPCQEPFKIIILLHTYLYYHIPTRSDYTLYLPCSMTWWLTSSTSSSVYYRSGSKQIMDSRFIQTLADAISTATVLSCLFLKVPQIMHIKNKRSADGLYIQAMLMEITG